MTDTARKMLKPCEAGEYIGGTREQTLALWRMLGKGPKYVKIGRRIFYRLSDLDQFIENNIRSGTGHVQTA